jgi:hypothetical protein
MQSINIPSCEVSSFERSGQLASSSPQTQLPRSRDHERRGLARAPALQAVTPKLGIQARVPEATLNISVEGAGWSTARAVACRRAVAHGEACLSPVAHALGTPATAHHCSRCAPASTMNADIEGRLRDAHLNTEFWRERLQRRRARRAAPFMVARVGRRSGAAPQICDRVLEVLATRHDGILIDCMNRIDTKASNIAYMPTSVSNRHILRLHRSQIDISYAYIGFKLTYPTLTF